MTTTRKILISEFMDAAAVDRLSSVFTVHYVPDLVDRPDALIAAAREVDALIVRNRTQVKGALLDALPDGVVIGRLGVGLDNIDVATAEARGIRVIAATGANADSVAEYVIATSLVLLRGSLLSSGEVAAGQWPRARLSNGREAAGKQLGLVGFGDIGQRVARLAHAIGMRVVAHDPVVAADDARWHATGVRAVTLDALLAESDVISLHVPLLPSTRGLIDAAKLARVKPRAVLINTARGQIVDEAALAQALRDGRLAGAAVDVFEHEPLPAQSALADAPNLILTPHVAGVTEESNVRVSALIADAVTEALLAREVVHGTH
ncbi:hydroxyacid dehydrogenase [Uliginosibacterium sp. sgz301328]|uniref:hydroxyacid dehydrogenase n=1 Tax=Uliginosibacterium sp. sgz301328 TaxID=3243764 RepID=UPI00359DA44E